jgi:Fe-S-cluster containining protein
MLRLTDDQSADLARAVKAAAEVGGLADAIQSLYRQVQDEVDRRRPICQISGRCCRFEEYGHRLFVTTAELAVFASQLPATGLSPAPADWDGRGCPFQVGGLCGVHKIRPFGCRIYFCDATSTQWQQDLYERFHHDLKALHERFAIPYLYVEWREGLRAIRQE